MRLFQYAVIFQPNDEERKKGEKAKLVVPLTEILSETVQTATLIAGRAIPEEYLDRLNQLEVAVRPF